MDYIGAFARVAAAENFNQRVTVGMGSGVDLEATPGELLDEFTSRRRAWPPISSETREERPECATRFH